MSGGSPNLHPFALKMLSRITSFVFQSSALNRRIPPRVKVDHRVGAGERETHPAGLEADEKDGNLRIALEFLHDGAAIRRRAIEVAELHVLRRELLLEECEHRRKLAEDQHAVTAVHRLL